MFECPICGKRYEDPVQMAKCIIACNDEVKENTQKVKAEFDKKAQIQLLKATRDAYKRYAELRNEYGRKYCNYIYPTMQEEFGIDRIINDTISLINVDDIIKSLERSLP